MINSWVIALCVTVCTLSGAVTGQFGVYYDSTRGEYRWHRSIKCFYNNLYNDNAQNAHTQSYIERSEVDCCYKMATRNKCCEKITPLGDTGVYSSKCFCDPTVSCGVPTYVTPAPKTTPRPPVTSRPVTRAPTVQPPSSPFCPVIQSRVLHSRHVTDKCRQFPGVFAVARPDMAFCHAVYGLAVVEGVTKLTLVTIEHCAKTVRAALRSKGEVFLDLGNGNKIPMSEFTTPLGHDGAAFFDFQSASIANRIMFACDQIVCGLQLPNMAGKVNYNKCKVASFGRYQASSFVQGGMREVDVRISPQSCSRIHIIDLENKLCFSTLDDSPVICSDDAGAPVLCETVSTGERVVIGMVAGAVDCGRSSTFYVVKYPTY